MLIFKLFPDKLFFLNQQSTRPRSKKKFLHENRAFSFFPRIKSTRKSFQKKSFMKHAVQQGHGRQETVVDALERELRVQKDALGSATDTAKVRERGLAERHK